MKVRCLARFAVAGLAAVGAAHALDAATVTLKSSVSGQSFDWSSSDSYAGGAAPASGDTVVIPAGVTAQLDATGAAFVNTLGRITPMDGAVLEVTVAEGAALSLAAPVSCYGVWDAPKASGTLRKKGAGTLKLTSVGKVMHGGVQYADYYCWTHVAEGSLAFPELADGEKTLYCRGATVDEGAWLYTAPVGHTALWGGLSGAGSVTNASASASKPVLEIYAKADDARSVFSGRLCGPFYLYGWAGFDLVGTSDSKSVVVVLNNGADMGVGTMGIKGGASSFGDGDLNFNKTSAIRYLGTETSTDRTFYLGDDSTIDAGAGGLTFTGHFGPNDTASKVMRTLTLAGTNETAESVLDNSFYASATDGTYGFHLVKRGSGVWRLKDNAKRLNTGVVATEAGTLRFDSIAETNEVCSLGLASALYRPVSGTPDEANRVPYAFLLGGTNEDATVTEGLMEYSGASAGYCASRLFAIRSAGGVRTSASAAPIRLNGFTAEDAGEKTLILDGDNTGENVAAGITNGPGVVSILKRGAGTWHLDGARDFSGSVTVDEGTLVARGATRYGWYRFTIRETGYATDTTTGRPSAYEQTLVDCRELALYDEDGNALEATLTQSNENWRAIQPGEFGYGRDGWTAKLKLLAQLLSGEVAKGLSSFEAPKTPRESDPSSWIPVIVRMPADAKPVVRFDLYYAQVNTTANAPYYNRQAKAFALEGSVDGFTWDELFVTNGVDYAAKASWVSNAETSFYSPRKDKGFAVASAASGKAVNALGNATSVSVKGGATLRVEGDSLPLTSLTVDCAAGVGTITGVTLAESGTLVLLNVPREGFVPIDFTGIGNAANLKGWTVSTPGLTKRRLVTVGDDGIRIASPGAVVVVR